MTDNVHQLGRADIGSVRREAFIQAVAQSFEFYVAHYGCEPDAVVYVLTGVKQPSQIAWVIDGDSKEGPTSILSIAAVHCMAEAGSSRQGLTDV